MKHQKALSWGLILVFIFSACQRTGEGPRSWIDQPLENSVFPKGNIILQAHASDSDGVAAMEFYLEGQTLIEVDPGGGRMGEAIYSWLPPGSGVYTIYVKSTDNNGNQGMAASSKITVMDTVAQVLPAEGE